MEEEEGKRNPENEGIEFVRGGPKEGGNGALLGGRNGGGGADRCQEG
jgi:hypothetical protein